MAMACDSVHFLLQVRLELVREHYGNMHPQCAILAIAAKSSSNTW